MKLIINKIRSYPPLKMIIKGTKKVYHLKTYLTVSQHDNMVISYVFLNSHIGRSKSEGKIF